MKKSTTIIAKGRGKTFFRSLAACQKRVQADSEYFIRRHGGWFRPGAHGYTNELAEAGVFAGADAKGYLQAEGVSLIPVASMLDTIWKQSREHITKAARLAKLVEHY